MGVNVVVYAGSSHPAYVDADIKATGIKYLSQDAAAPADYLDLLM